MKPIAVSTTIVALAAAVATSPTESAKADSEASVPSSPQLREFDADFPVLRDGRNLTDIDLFRLFVSNDFIGFLAHEDQAVSDKLGELDDKPYQREKYEQELRRHTALSEEFRRRRNALSGSIFYYTVSPDDQPSVEMKYIDKQFRLQTNCSTTSADKIAMTVVTNGELESLNDTDISAGRSHRSDCWSDPETTETCCGLRLPDLPTRLKASIEDEFGKTVHLRWRWRGFGEPTKTNLLLYGGIPATFHKAKVRVAWDIAAELVDDEGKVLWTAR